MSDGRNFWRTLLRLREPIALKPQDEDTISRLAENERTRAESILRPEACPATADIYISDPHYKMRVFTDGSDGLSEFGWRKIPAGSGGPKIQGGAYGDIVVAYKLSDVGLPIESRHLCAGKIMGGNKWRETWREVEILKGVVHENVVDYFGCFAVTHEVMDTNDQLVTAVRQFWILLEYASAGDLRKEINRFGGMGIQEDGTLFYMHQILSGLKYLHSKGIEHRDLHPKNVLLKYNTQDLTKVCMLCDFGCSDLLLPRDLKKRDVWQRDVFQACYLTYEMMTEEDEGRVRGLSPQVLQVIACRSDEKAAPLTVQQMLSFAWFARPGVPPVPPRDPTPLLKPETLQAIGYLPPLGSAAAASSAPASRSFLQRFRRRQPSPQVAPALPLTPIPGPSTRGHASIEVPPTVYPEAMQARLQAIRQQHQQSSRQDIPSRARVGEQPLPQPPRPSLVSRVSSFGQTVGHRLQSLNCFHGRSGGNLGSRTAPPARSERTASGSASSTSSGTRTPSQSSRSGPPSPFDSPF